MGILDSLFGKNKIKGLSDAPIQYQQLMDAILDWFKQDKISLEAFEKEHFNPIWEIIQAQYAKHDSVPAHVDFFPGYATYYILAKTTSENETVKRLEQIANIITSNKLGQWEKENFLPITRNLVEEENKNLFQLFQRGEQIANVYMTILNLYENYAYKDKIVLDDFEYYSKLLAQMKVNKLPILSQLYQYSSSYEDYVPSPHKGQVTELLKREIIENSANKLLNADIVIDYLDLLNLRHTKECKEIRDIKKLNANKVPQLVNLIHKSQGKEADYISNMLSMMKRVKVPYSISDKILQDILLSIIGNHKFDKSWIVSTFKEIDYFNINILRKTLDNIKEDLAYNNELILLYEEYAFSQVQDYDWRLNKNDLKFLEYFYQQIADPKIKNLYLKRISAPKVVTITNTPNYHKYCHIVDNEKLLISKELIAELNYILPITIKSTNTREYSHEDNIVIRAHLISNGKELGITENAVLELNEFLSNKNTGYQIVPIPICIKEYTRYRNDETVLYCLGALAIFNYEEYSYLKTLHDTSALFECIFDKVNYTKKDAMPFDELKQSASIQEQKSVFCDNTDWQWFKDDYIDKLSSKEKWYQIMDVIIQCTGTKTMNKKWATELSPLLDKFPSEQYFRELQSMLAGSLNQDFWYFDTYEKGLKGLIWSCTMIPTEQSLNILRQIVEKAYTKVPGIGPRSTALGNFAINALLDTGKEEAFGMLNVMRNKTKYNRFAVALDKAIDKFKGTLDIPEELLADKTIPRFDFDDEFKKNIPIGDYTLCIFFENGKMQKQWIDADGKLQKTIPAVLKDNFASQLKELNDETKQINALFADLSKRIITYWLYDRSWTAKDWEEYILKHPLINPHIQQLVWTNKTKNEDFIVLGKNLQSINGDVYKLQDSDEIILWHPILNTTQNVSQWQEYIWTNKIVQGQRQVFREFYPFSEKEIASIESKRFADHFLEVSKLMAIANNTGWIFTYSHEDDSWPRIYLKQIDLTFHLKCDYNRNEFAIPSQEIFATRGKSTDLGYRKEFCKIPFSEIPLVTLSELCRDVDLFIAITSVANNPDLAQRQKYESYYMTYEKGLFSENASAKIRKQILEKLIPVLAINSAGFDGNFLLIDGSINSYKINLGSGFAQTKEGKHINLIPSLNGIKKNKKITLPIEDDDILLIIIAKAMLLSDDKSIIDIDILGMLK